jgi:hypothetical protein
MDGFSFLSLEYTPSGAGTKTLTVYASNSDVDDPATAVYIDVTTDFFGAASFTTTSWLERDTHMCVKWVKVQVAVTGLGGTGTWSLLARKNV